MVVVGKGVGRTEGTAVGVVSIALTLDSGTNTLLNNAATEGSLATACVTKLRVKLAVDELTGSI